jgi:electron transfer flavoprotein alpha/beta subunit
MCLRAEINRIFLMKDLAAVEEAVDLGAKNYEGEIFF